MIFVGLYAFYLFDIQGVPVSVSSFAKLITYPFVFTYGLIMLVVAYLLEKITIQRLGLLIMLIPIIVSIVGSLLKDRKIQIDN